jgi:cytoskeleton protein RodZ
MTLEELGALLRQERERQGMSLEKAATEIKISKKYLVALEEGVTKDLPHPVYAKGFVKNYARLLGLNSEELGAAFSAHYAVDEDHLRDAPRYEVHDASPGVKERKTSLSGRVKPGGFSPSLWLAVPLVLVFAGAGWFFFFSNFAKDFNMDSVTGFFKSKFEAPDAAKPGKAGNSQQGAASQPPAASAKPDAKPDAKPESKPAAKQEPAPAATDTAGVSRELLAVTPGQGKPVQQPAPEQDITPEKLSAEAKFATQGNQTLEVNASQPAVLEVTAEDGQRRAFTLVKGQRITLRFADKMSIRFQQAPGVAIKLNGKDYPLEGGKADGRTLQFP